MTDADHHWHLLEVEDFRDRQTVFSSLEMNERSVMIDCDANFDVTFAQ